jgi:hypothetical protein
MSKADTLLAERRAETFLKLSERDRRNEGEVLCRDEIRFVIFTLSSGRTLFEWFSADAPCSDLYEFLESEGAPCERPLSVKHNRDWVVIRRDGVALRRRLAAPRANLFERASPKS